MMGMTAVSDGKTFWFCMNMMKQYAKQPAPAQLSGLAQAAPMLRTQLGPFAFLRGEDPLAGKPKVKLVGEERVAGKPCHHLAWTQTVPSHMGGSPPRMSLDAWIGKADLLLYQTRLVVSGSMGQAKAKYTTTVTEAHTGMKANQPVPGKTFTFSAPEGAEQVDKFGMPGAPGKPKPAPSKAR
jgi:outer membrane lipoprotein-sorting protein